MSTTHRGESIHPFFDGHINSTTSLQQFVQLYDIALYGKIEKEFEAYLRSFNTTIGCGSNSMIMQNLMRCKLNLEQKLIVLCPLGMWKVTFVLMMSWRT